MSEQGLAPFAVDATAKPHGRRTSNTQNSSESPKSNAPPASARFKLPFGLLRRAPSVLQEGLGDKTKSWKQFVPNKGADRRVRLQ